VEVAVEIPESSFSIFVVLQPWYVLEAATAIVRL